MLQLMRPRRVVSRLQAGHVFVFPPATRSLRTARGGTRRHKDHLARMAKLEALAHEAEWAREAQRQRVLEARTAPPVLPAFIRVRDLAKALRQPLDQVLKRTVTRTNRRFYLKTKSHPRAEFQSVKHIVLPFRVAREVAESFNIETAYEDVEPHLSDVMTRDRQEGLGRRQPVLAVLGHVDHGKTTLLDTLRQQTKTGVVRAIAPYEKHGITQKINVCEAAVTPEVKVTFLDTPGHFHFFRMRSNAAQVADAVLLIVAADEGVLLQTEESIGAIEDAQLPAILCINKVDVLQDSGEQVAKVVEDLRSFVALQHSPVVVISGKTGAGLDELKQTVGKLVTTLANERKLDALVGSETDAEGLVLESVACTGRGTVLRVLIKHGKVKAKQHFVAGMIHGVVRTMRDADGRQVERALPGTVVDITYANRSKNVDAPNEHGFFVLTEARAKQVIEQRELALELHGCLLSDEVEASNPSEAETSTTGTAALPEKTRNDGETVAKDGDDGIDEESLIETKSIIVKADGAGSLTSIQDTVDEMGGISTVRLGIGNVSVNDIDVAINGKCPIFGFNVKLRSREAKLAAKKGVRVILRSTVHEVIEEIVAFDQTGSEDALCNK